MNTEIIKVDADNPCEADIKKAAVIIRGGGLVAFPTETVYGLGANAFNSEAVSRIYAVKNRPADNPLIWHANDLKTLETIAEFGSLSNTARRLACAFWPGPLTLVLPWKKNAPSSVAYASSKFPSVAVRVPSHPVFRSLINISGCIIAAPSANTSGKPSPTLAAHVSEDISGTIEMIIDGGAAQNGLESTVIDLRSDKPFILRPGAVTAEMLASVIGECENILHTESSVPPSPGMKYRHYAPQAPITLIIGLQIHESAAYEILSRILKEFHSHLLCSQESKAFILGVLATEDNLSLYRECLNKNGYQWECIGENEFFAKDSRGAKIIIYSAGKRAIPSDIAKNLFALLRKFDRHDVSAIYAEGIDESGIGAAVMNRLRKAAAEVIILK